MIQLNIYKLYPTFVDEIDEIPLQIVLYFSKFFTSTIKVLTSLKSSQIIGLKEIKFITSQKHRSFDNIISYTYTFHCTVVTLIYL